MVEDERDVIQSASGGKAEAFGLLYDHYVTQIYRFILVKVSGQREEAEDLTHQVFLQAWHGMRKGQYQDLGLPFSSWLYQIARNLVIDHYRRTRPTVELDEERHDTPVDLDNEARIDKKRRVTVLLRALENMKEAERELILLRFVEDLSVRETAAAMGKTEGAIKVMQHRTLAKLKKNIGDES